MKKQITLTITASILAISAFGFIGSLNPVNAQDLKPQKQEERIEAMKEIRDAMKRGDYDTWKDAVSKLPNKGEEILKKIDTKEKFEKLMKLHNLRKEARTLKNDLGLKNGNRRDKIFIKMKNQRERIFNKM